MTADNLWLDATCQQCSRTEQVQWCAIWQQFLCSTCKYDWSAAELKKIQATALTDLADKPAASSHREGGWPWLKRQTPRS